MSRIIATHDGKFHADDVFAVAALLLLLGDDAEVIRTRDNEKLGKADYIVDVGGIFDGTHNRFDHHQVGGAGVRLTSIPFASFGLVWQKFGAKICGNADVARRVEEVLVIPVDANDNGVNISMPSISGVSSYCISDAIRAFIPTWQEEDALSGERFTEAMLFAKRIIEREVKRAEAVIAGEAKVKKIYANTSDKRLIVLSEDFSWKETLARLPEPLLVVHPQNGAWRLYCVRDNPHVFANRKDLPKPWAGLRDVALAKVTGVQDAVFCHRNRFMAIAESKEGALALARKALAS